MKITNDDLWQKIKAGELKGLSIEGYFTNKFEQMQKKEPTDAEILSALNEIIKEKTELKSKKVELGAVDDLIKDATTLNSKYEKAVKNQMTIAKLVNENFKELGSVVKAAKKGYKIVSTLDKQFKELGVKPPQKYKTASRDIYDIAEGAGEQMFKDLAKFKGLI